ncbi:hypothetical protein D9619_010066 [Psilocybe cf. subviscida]|uniref:Transmembrane protein n=1 Tax=Psilocybe cf. subviscida TaxID=2480587 RepID=A0A8H5BN66_9AGAR|nr:hypothetical protein D9619_010066 [Psilocybe cf. subviscida]
MNRPSAISFLRPVPPRTYLQASMIRPAPLQLKFDNRFPREPFSSFQSPVVAIAAAYPVRTTSKPKSPTFVSQLYKASWKNPVIAVAGLNGLRFAFAAYNAFEDAMIDDAEGVASLLRVSVALCVMYIVAFLIEVYGIIGLSMQRFSLVRMYLYLAGVASFLAIAAGVLNGVAYFAFAEDLMYECVSLAMEGRAWEKAIFRTRPWPRSTHHLHEIVARRQCMKAWLSQSWAQVASVFLFSLIPAVAHYMMVYTYYMQTMDSNHSAYLMHASPPTAASYTHTRDGAANTERRNGYSRVATGPSNRDATTTRQRRDRNNASVGVVQRSSGAVTGSSMFPLSATRRRQGQAARSVRGVSVYAYDPPASNFTSTGSPSSRGSSGSGGSGSKRYSYRSLQRSRRPPPLISSPEPIGLTPGPPSYRPARVYAAFAAPVASNGEYDKFI